MSTNFSLSLKLLSILFLLLFAGISKSTAQSKIENSWAFGDKEYLEYTVSYHWGLIWIDAGKVDFKAKAIRNKDENAWHFFSTGMSFRKFDWFFKVRDTFEVISSYKGLKPIRFKRHTHEGGYVIFNDYTFDHQNLSVTAISEETRKARSIDTISITSKTLDVLTATYFVRSIDFKNMKMNDTLGIEMILDGVVFTLPIVFHGYETYKNRDGKKYNCIKFSALLEKGTMFRAGEQLFVRVTNDKNKIPVMIEAKITVGSIKVNLSGFENLKHPLNSMVY
ncbi:MAG: DUF3108 domain-containing protein [Bacteroidales bacterium]|nr:DUF3108 domain-containing protein [Bacteroidales bacterium]